MVLRFTRGARHNGSMLTVSASVHRSPVSTDALDQRPPRLPRTPQVPKISTHSGKDYRLMTTDQRTEYNRWCYERKVAKKKAGAA